MVAALIAVGLAAGSVHVVRGGKVWRARGWPGITVCRKRLWTLRNTFINTDDYVGQPKLVAALDAQVVLALGDCGLLYYPPEAWPDPDPNVM
ncbi:MAG: hypothetical protein E6J91_08905 [Deltaproteobacteria bacterium]|nr:MAG: hypothetical protein E6J91_08905 [Deltaproteobacteria bacterium]